MSQEQQQQHRDVEALVIGGGLAGLSAAVRLAAAGRRVVVVEGAGAIGGRATTQASQGFALNQGAHALYAEGAGRRILRRLGVEVEGSPPPGHGLFAVDEKNLHVLPSGPVGLVRTGLLSWREKLEAGRFLATVTKQSVEGLEAVPMSRWIDDHVATPGVRRLLRALVRLTTYCADPELLSAKAAVAQLQRGIETSVLYLDGGWQTLVDGLAARLAEHGGELCTGCRVASVGRSAAGLGARTSDGAVYRADSVILAVDPQTVARLLPGSAIAVRVSAAQPARAGCLDVGLDRLPEPGRLFALGIDEPFYLSVHSASARLAPEGKALVHVMRYLRQGEEIERELLREQLEVFLERLQPGWRQHVVTSRFHQMPVCHDIVPAGRAGFATDDAGVEGVLLAGDWVGPELLADGAIDSGWRAGGRVLEVEERQAAVA